MAAKPNQPDVKPLDALFAEEPDRLSRLSFAVAGLYFDWSKTHLDRALIDRFAARAEDCGLAAARDALFSGGIVNPSEGRPATHVAERGNGAPDDVDLATARRQRMRALVDAIEAGAFGDITGILHIGIGGSLLGPALLVDALGRRRSKLDVRFLSNIDGEAFDEAVTPLDPATTLVVVVSKTFTTAETLANMDSALGWLREAGVSDQRRVHVRQSFGSGESLGDNDHQSRCRIERFDRVLERQAIDVRQETHIDLRDASAERID